MRVSGQVANPVLRAGGYNDGGLSGAATQFRP
jgi:hypothetical protein